MNKSEKLTFDDLRELIARTLDVDASALHADTRFIEDLGIDSLASLDIVLDLESEFHIKISAEDGRRITSLQSAWELVEAKFAMRST